ncbi:MAG: ATP-binding protein [Chloroflexota bacterium]
MTETLGIKYHPFMVAMDNEAVRVFQDAALGDLGQIRQYVRETAVSFGCAPAAADELVVAVNEAAANIIRHGFKHEPGAIQITVVCGADTVKVLLHDHAPGFDPTTLSNPDTTLALEERPFGGMGVYMMRTFCDGLSYCRNSQGENELTLLKRMSR